MIKIYSFILDDKPFIAKKFKPIESLYNVRIAFKTKINSSILFTYEKIPILIEDETKFTLEDIEDSSKIYLKTSNQKNFKIYLNGKLLIDYNGNEKEKLKSLRKNLGNKININCQFLLKNDNKIDIEDEEGDEGFTIGEIEKNGNIYIEENNKLEKNEKENKNNSEDILINYKFYWEDNKLICSLKLLPNIPLYSIRTKISNKIKDFENGIFLNKNKEIKKNEENDIEIKDIDNDGIIFIRNVSKNNEEKSNNIIEKEYYFEIENKNKFMKKFNTNENLLIVRIELKDKISDSIVFSVNGYEINKKDEEQFTLGLIEENGIIKLKQLKSIIKNKPIQGSILIKNQNGLKIYKYPKITFNNVEETNAITFMLIGEKGVGKTTLLNSFINFILGIQFDDDFRYNN